MSKTMQAGIVAGVSAILLMGFLVASKLMKPAPLDAKGCGQTIASKTVIVLDTSDGVPVQTHQEIIDRVKNRIDKKVQDGDLVSVFTISALSKKSLVPAFAYCKPRRIGNALKESTRILERTYLMKFQKPLEAAIRAPIQGSMESPIAQSLVDLSLSDYVRSNGNTTLIVFSDMMEYTDRFSLYNCDSGSLAIKSFRDSRGAAVARPTFHNVDIEINIIPRIGTTAAVGRCRDTFWAWFFGDDEGPSARFTPSNLPG
ncbi:hypothetical protein [Caballeronia sp. LZ035]|uniref:hypothetical protein n=1 Tax=Caballeronia sp. LZ035 TaxID=3038568 RepID=UPI002857D261|nr:hypothetical protein [Caballeronia sp. LZ035]MDR5757794.1 hypothetical protein [Caballeronia sp. LZ035]